jgi:hypothetical protein
MTALNDDQKKFLQLVAAGLRDGSVGRAWTLIPAPNFGFVNIYHFGNTKTSEAWEATRNNIAQKDIDSYEQAGFLKRDGDRYLIDDTKLLAASEKNFA